MQVGTVTFTAGDETMEVPDGVAHKFTKLRRRTAQEALRQQERYGVGHKGDKRVLGIEERRREGFHAQEALALLWRRSLTTSWSGSRGGSWKEREPRG